MPGADHRPYLIGYALQGAHQRFGWYAWLGYNFDDSCVYLSWMRQASDGHFFQRNLFATDPQSGHQFNLFFLILGNFARFSHLPLLAVWHISRIVLGVFFLRAVWWLIDWSSRTSVRAGLRICWSAFHPGWAGFPASCGPTAAMKCRSMCGSRKPSRSCSLISIRSSLFHCC